MALVKPCRESAGFCGHTIAMQAGFSGMHQHHKKNVLFLGVHFLNGIGGDGMSKGELIEELIKAEQELDIEEAHIKADELLLEYIDDVEITRAFDNIHKWYV